MKRALFTGVLGLCMLGMAVVCTVNHAEEFLWGTEGQGLLVSNHLEIPPEKQNIIHQINDVMGLKLIKVRLRLPINQQWGVDMCSLRGAHFTADQPECSIPGSLSYNLDETAALFKANGWSMLPMFSHAGAPGQNPLIDQEHIDRYVDFVDWFLDRYRKDADIRYIELVNAPYHTWKGTAQQLLELCNKTYERIKEKHPQVQVGTPGFEYYRDTDKRIRGKDQFRFRNYFLEHDAKFDFWAFHGYPALGNAGPFDFYPPTRTAIQDRFAGIYGIILLRQRLNQNGWHQRKIIDTEHTGLLVPKKTFDETDDRVNVAFITQQLVLKRSLMFEGKPVLDGIVTLKMSPRCHRIRPGRDWGNKWPSGNRRRRSSAIGQTRDMSQQSAQGTDLSQPLFSGECAWGTLNPDGSASLSVKAAGILIGKLSEMNHAEHISGAFDDDHTIWIEKFQNSDQDLFVCFKPFVHSPGQKTQLEDKKRAYQIKLEKVPTTIKITDMFGNITVVDPETTIHQAVGNVPHIVEVIY